MTTNSANALTYLVNRTVGSYSVTGTLTTGGIGETGNHLGVDWEIIDWNLVLNDGLGNI